MLEALSLIQMLREGFVLLADRQILSYTDDERSVTEGSGLIPQICEESVSAAERRAKVPDAFFLEKLAGFDYGRRRAPLKITIYYFINEAVSYMPQRFHKVIEQDVLSMIAHNEVICGGVEGCPPRHNLELSGYLTSIIHLE